MNPLPASSRIGVYIDIVVVGGGLNRKTDLTGDPERKSTVRVGVAIGAGVGEALGVALDNIAVGVIVGVVVRAALGAALKTKSETGSPEESFDQIRSRADGGDPVAQDNLGTTYRDGRGVAQDDAEAVRWFRRAVKQRNPLGQVSLVVTNG